MTKLLNGSEFNNLLATKIKPDCSVRMAVAFWGVGAMKNLNLEGNRNAQLICNLSTGGTNPYEIQDMIASGLNVRMLNSLHAKIGIIGSDFSFVGSSNMSANGLGFEGKELAGWEEANSITEGIDPSIQARFEELWNQSEEITRSDLKTAKQNWGQRRVFAISQSTKEQKETKSLWEAIENQSNSLRSIPCHVAYYYEMKDKDTEFFSEAQAEIKGEFGERCNVYQDWDALPEGYIIGVCRSRKRKGTLKDIDFSLRLPNTPIYKYDGVGFLVLAKEKAIPEYMALSGNDLKQFKALILAYVGTKRKPKKSRAIPIQKLMEFARNRKTND